MVNTKNLYKINDILNESFIRLPVALIANPKYKGLSSDAKILYSLLCNRLKLSQLNNWINENGEVYLIYTREQAADTLGLSYKTIIKTFKALIEIGLVFEERRGKSLANHIYLCKPEECDKKQTQDFNEKADAPFKGEVHGEVMCKNDSSLAENPIIEPQSDMSDLHISDESDAQNLQFMTCKNDSSGGVKSTVLDMSNLHPSKKEIKKKDFSKLEKSQSVCLDDESEKITLDFILQQCELECFEDSEVANIYQSAIERLFYCDAYKIGNSCLPRDKVRSYLLRLDYDILLAVHSVVCRNTTRIKNKISYIMTMLINAVCEQNIEMYIYKQEFDNMTKGMI